MENTKTDGVLNLVTFALTIGLIFWKAFILIKMWDWFIIPTFTSAPTLNYPQAIGITAIVGFLCHHQNKTEKENLLDMLFQAYVYSLISLLIAWITSMFM